MAINPAVLQLAYLAGKFIFREVSERVGNRKLRKTFKILAELVALAEKNFPPGSGGEKKEYVLNRFVEQRPSLAESYDPHELSLFVDHLADGATTHGEHPNEPDLDMDDDTLVVEMALDTLRHHGQAALARELEEMFLMDGD